MAEFFTSDPHYNHAKIIEYCSRPFIDVNHMNEALILNYNSVVGPDDTTYIIGDVCMGKKDLIPSFMSGLNGQKILIRGNHDPSMTKLLAMGCFKEVHDQLDIVLDGHKLHLQHVPVATSKDHHRLIYDPALSVAPTQSYDYFLAGHTHERWRRLGNVINVGVDQWEYFPVTLQQLLNCAETKPSEIKDKRNET